MSLPQLSQPLCLILMQSHNHAHAYTTPYMHSIHWNMYLLSHTHKWHFAPGVSVQHQWVWTLSQKPPQCLTFQFIHSCHQQIRHSLPPSPSTFSFPQHYFILPFLYMLWLTILKRCSHSCAKSGCVSVFVKQVTEHHLESPTDLFLSRIFL